VLRRLRRWCVARVPAAVHPALSAAFHGETTAQRSLVRELAVLRTARERRRLSGRDAVRSVLARQGPMLAATVDRFNAAQVLNDSLALVVDALEAAQVPYALLEAGVEIYEFRPTMLHQKTMLVDGVWATIGTANFDNRSFALNEETNLCFHDRAIAEQLHAIFAADLERCERIDFAAWRRRGLWRRIQEQFASLLEDQI